MCGCGRVYKDILKGLSLYFNPGELVGIMGPSGEMCTCIYLIIHKYTIGSGKTTFLDLLTGRRNTGTISVGRDDFQLRFYFCHIRERFI